MVKGITDGIAYRLDSESAVTVAGKTILSISNDDSIVNIRFTDATELEIKIDDNQLRVLFCVPDSDGI
jgi:hypothetical protein